MNDWEKRRIEARKEAFEVADWLDASADCLQARGWIPWHRKPNGCASDDEITKDLWGFMSEPGRTQEEIVTELRRLADFYYTIGALI